MKDAGHLDQIRRLRISDKDLDPLAAAYDVRDPNGHSIKLAPACSHAVPDCPYSAEGDLSAPFVNALNKTNQPDPLAG